MTDAIKKALVGSVFDRTCEDIDANTSTCIGATEALTKLKRCDLWNKAREFLGFDDQDIGDNGEIGEMEDIWAGLVEKSVKYNFPNFRMVLETLDKLLENV